MLHGWYRGVTGTVVHVREVWGRPEEFVAEWRDNGRLQSEKLSRAELERMIAAGLLKREVS